MRQVVPIYLLLTAVTALASASQQPNTPTGSKTTPAAGSSQEEMMPMPLVAPLFVQNGALSSTVTIVNAAAAATTADVILLDRHGVQVAKSSAELEGHSQKALKIGDLLDAAHATLSVGSVEIMPATKAAKDMSVVAQLSIVDSDTSPPIYLEEEFLMPTPMGSNKYQAAASSVIGDPVLALMSMSTGPQSVSVTCISEHGDKSNAVQTLQLAAGQMILTSACDSGPNRISKFDDGWNQANLREKGGAVGLSVVTTGKPGDLAVYGFAPGGEQHHPVYTALNFIDAGMLRSSNTVFTGVPVGHSDLFPANTFKTEIAVANFSMQPAVVKVLYATTDETGTSSNTVAAATLAASASKTIELSLNGDALMRNSFIIQSSAPPGTLAANLTAIGDASIGTVQLIGKDQQQHPNSGAHPWTNADGMTSTLLLLNHSNADQTFDVNISTAGVLWQQEYKLAAMETKSLSINDVIATGAKDKKGKVIPKHATTGEVGWSVPKASEGTGRLLVSRPDVALARSFSCGTQDVECGLDLNSYALDLLIGTGGTLGPAQAQYCLTCWPNCGPCTGSYDYDKGADVTWSSENTSIATVDYNGTVTGQSGGSVGIDASGDAFCMQTSGTATVQVPTYFEAIDAFTVSGGCDPGMQGSFFSVKYQVEDQNGNPIQVSGMKPLENAPGTNGTYQPFATPSTTAADGTFNDTPVGTCFTNTIQNVCVSVTQSFQLVDTNNNTYAITTTTGRRDCEYGQSLTTTGNLPGKDHTYTQGTVN